MGYGTNIADSQPRTAWSGHCPESSNNLKHHDLGQRRVENYTGAWTYNWMTTGTVVNVDQSSAITSGTIVLTIKDSEGKTVYSGDMSQGGTLNFRTEKNK